jgi:hypothetical protein
VRRRRPHTRSSTRSIRVAARDRRAGSTRGPPSLITTRVVEALLAHGLDELRRRLAVESRAPSAPCRRAVRETAMLAMLTPAFAEERAHRARSRPARRRSGRRPSAGASSISSSKPSAFTSQCRFSVPMIVPRREALAVRGDLDADEVVKSRDARRPLLGDLDPALGCDHRRVDVVDRLVERPWKAPFSAAAVSSGVS